MSWYKQQLEVTIKLISLYFSSQIDVIVFDISLNIFLKAWLIVFLTNELPSLINTKMPS